MRKTGSGATRKTTRREDPRNVRQALVDPTVTRSTIRADVVVATVPQTISRHLVSPELAVQDLWAHLPQDNIRCLINSMPSRVAACIAPGGGPTRY
ncbi:hypothetical protein TNCV_2474401 [Trichonephila clavipes]|nr:hypothetical protein TNCV_2474401 [Trichonephila clavipes]